MSPAATTTGAPVLSSGAATWGAKFCESRFEEEQPPVAITRTRVAKATDATLPMARREAGLATGFGEGAESPRHTPWVGRIRVRCTGAGPKPETSGVDLSLFNPEEPLPGWPNCFSSELIPHHHCSRRAPLLGSPEPRLVWHNIIPHPSLKGGVSASSHRERHVQRTSEQRGAYHPPGPFFGALVGLGGRIGPW